MGILLSNYISLSLALAAIAGVIVVILAQVRNNREQLKLLEILKQNRAEPMLEDETVTLDTVTVEQLEALEETWQSRFDAALQRIHFLTERCEEFEKQLAGLQGAVQEVADQDPESRFYQRAAKLVQQGASIEEIMEACELPRAEAELVVSLYGKS